MLATFGTIKNYIKLFPTSVSIDNPVFKLHYRITTLIFIVATILVCSRQYIGEHIRCITDHGVPLHVIDTFCFITTTFTIVKYLNATLLNMEAIAHPGVGSSSPFAGLETSTEPVIRHTYYQWVPFLLFGQAIMFHLPHLIWKHFEGKRMNRLIDGFKYAAFAVSHKSYTVGNNVIPSIEMRDEQMHSVYENFMKRLYVNRSWSFWLTFCEFLNFANVLLQIYITNQFLGGRFINLGPELVLKGTESSVDILDVTFPKVTKCTFFKYGPTGTIQAHDAMCVMALNIINDKIYSFLWFWFSFLLLASFFAILWRLLTFFLHARSHTFNKLVFSMSCPGRLNPWDVITVTKHCSYTDWLFLYYVSKNMDALVFRELLIGLAGELDKKSPFAERTLKLDNEKENMIKLE